MTRAVLATRTAIVVAMLLSAVPPAAPAQDRAGVARRWPRQRLAAAAGDTLAWVGPDAVTARELRQRVELMPWVEKAVGRDPDSARVRALQSLVAEKLLAREAERLGLDRAGRLPRLVAALERALLRDALYRHEVVGRASESEAAVDSLVRTWPARGSVARRRQAAADTLRARGEEALARELAAQVLGGTEARVDEAAFVKLAEALHAAVTAAESAHVVANGWRLAPDDYDAAIEALAPDLGLALVRLAGDSLTLGDALESFRYQRFVVSSLRPRTFGAQLQAALRAVVEGELLAREARRRGLAADPELQREVRMWTDAWKAEAVRLRLAAAPAVREDDAFRLFARRDPEGAIAACAVDLEEVLCASEREAHDVLAALRAGAPFDSVARERTRRAAWETSGGRSGFFAVSERPVLGYRALLARQDSLGGPLRLPEGWSVYRVRDKRLLATDAASRLAFEHVREAAAREAHAAAVTQRVADLAEVAPPRFDLARLRATEVSPLNLATKRMLGFGGEMTAAPMVVPSFDWVRERARRIGVQP